MEETKEQKFIINNGDQTYTYREMVTDNDEEVVASIEGKRLRDLKKGESMYIGGGAQPRIKITRIL